MSYELESHWNWYRLKGGLNQGLVSCGLDIKLLDINKKLTILYVITSDDIIGDNFCFVLGSA